MKNKEKTLQYIANLQSWLDCFGEESEPEAVAACEAEIATLKLSLVD